MSTAPLLPDDLHAATAGLSIVRAEPLDPLLPEGATGSWRLTLQDDSTVKGQLLWSARRCERAREMIRALDDVGAPQVVAWYGRALVQEWVEGDAADPDAHARAAGDLLGRIHRTPIPASAADGVRWQPDAARTRQGLGALTEHGALEAADGDLALRLLPDASMCSRDLVVTHGDLAPGNVVASPGPGFTLVPVDNEACDAAPAEWDVARTWYRWPMTPDARNEFRTAYEAVTGRDAVSDGFAGWLVAVLVDAAAYRLRGNVDSNVPLRGLQNCLRGARDGRTGEQMFSESAETCDYERP